jgi:CheY-like chemotaxis protein
MSAALADFEKKPRKALIVDDDPVVVKFLRDRCVRMGLEVQEASNGLQALVMARRDPPDVLIVDVHLPELDGLSLCSTLLRPNRKGIDVIVVSGYSESETAQRCESFGATYATKGPQLWTTVRSALKQIFPGMTVDIPGTGSPPSIRVRERPLILVIDDDSDVGEFLVTRLRKCGVDAILAADGQEGYQIAFREKPSVIISDYLMPKGDLSCFLLKLRGQPGFNKIPVFAITGHNLDRATEEDLIRGFFGQRGVERIFKKPFDIDELFLAIQKHCALKYRSVK